MTVAELISHLQTFPPDLEVIVSSYEQGYDPVTDLRELTIEKSPDAPWYVGVYDDAPASNHKALLIRSRFLWAEKKS